MPVASQFATSHPMRTSVRFPLHLPVRVRTDDGIIDAMTLDISATGVQFSMAVAPGVNARLAWTMRLPGSVLGMPTDVVVNCVGRVVWQTRSLAGRSVGAVIDSYRMEDDRVA